MVYLSLRLPGYKPGYSSLTPGYSHPCYTSGMPIYHPCYTSGMPIYHPGNEGGMRRILPGGYGRHEAHTTRGVWWACRLYYPGTMVGMQAILPGYHGGYAPPGLCSLPTMVGIPLLGYVASLHTLGIPAILPLVDVPATGATSVLTAGR